MGAYKLNWSEVISFSPGRLYERTALLSKYGGKSQVGICISPNYPVIFLFDTPGEREYENIQGWEDDGIFRWIGEGQEGDQILTKENLALNSHLENGKDVHLFKHEKPGLFRYGGQMVCIGYEWGSGQDKYDNERKIIIFNLKPFETLIHDDLLEKSESEYSLAELRELALSQSSERPRNREQQIRNIWVTSRAIREYALKRAEGKCESCLMEAPFVTSSKRPYLEVHHIRRLSDGGPDDPLWVAAICPNCHREAHYSFNRNEFNQDLRQKIFSKEYC